LEKSIADFLKHNPPSFIDCCGGISCDVAVYCVDVSTAFTRNIEVELGVDRKYHTYRRGWLCDISDKPRDLSEVYYLIFSSFGDWLNILARRQLRENKYFMSRTIARFSK
jgi:hypothetical protein